MRSLFASIRVTRHLTNAQRLRFFSIQVLKGSEFKKLLESRARTKYCIMDIREPEEHEMLSLEAQNIDKKFPLMSFGTWKEEIESMDRAKPVVLVVGLHKFLC